ncbi:hypothetical protein [Erythrobacter sp. JK5]|uniref:hypothetical protein n=1 Tax=Erythrobacter sp. JK5 TaxID=2829500 RepID=UPI001BAA1163|nr:hypothetical protein [Erythrobacter sp. JK5]QUL38939.1 hypothetical protein KDC96_06200 [Erythrobacter sp. JK5]
MRSRIPAFAAIVFAVVGIAPLSADQPMERGPVLVSFDGGHQLAREASRQRLLSQILHYALTIDADGKPIGCALSYKFRRKATEIALCRPLLKYMRFEPARDADGNAVPGTFTGAIDFDMWMTQRGYLEPEDR